LGLVNTFSASSFMEAAEIEVAVVTVRAYLAVGETKPDVRSGLRERRVMIQERMVLVLVVVCLLSFDLCSLSQPSAQSLNKGLDIY